MKSMKSFMLLCFVLGLSCERSFEPSYSRGWFLQRSQQDSITYYAIDFADDNNGWIAGDSGTIKHSSNGGDSWTSQQSGVSSNFWDICFINSKTGWICGSDNTILKTINGGSTWQNISPTDTSDRIFIAIQFTDANNGWASSNYGEILKTTDGGLTWKIRKKFSLGGGCRLAVFSENMMYFYHGLLYRTSDGGITWDSLTVTKPRDFAISNMCFANENSGYLATENGTGGSMITEFPVIMTEDSGVTWKLSDSLQTLGFSCVYFVDKNNGWIAGNNNVYKTNDGGQSWALDFSPETGTLGTRDIFFINTSCGWILNYNGEIYKYQIHTY